MTAITILVIVSIFIGALVLAVIRIRSFLRLRRALRDWGNDDGSNEETEDRLIAAVSVLGQQISSLADKVEDRTTETEAGRRSAAGSAALCPNCGFVSISGRTPVPYVLFSPLFNNAWRFAVGHPHERPIVPNDVRIMNRQEQHEWWLQEDAHDPMSNISGEQMQVSQIYRD